MISSKKAFALVLLLGGTAGFGCQRASRSPAPAEPRTEAEQVFYALGMEFGRRVAALSMSPTELEMVKAGLADGATKTASKVDLEKIRPASEALTAKRKKASADEENRKGMAFIENVAREPGARRLNGGVVVKTLRPGTGPNPGATDIITVKYEGRLLDGTVFESSANDQRPLQVGLLVVMSCWQIGIPAIRVGEKAEVLCPAEVAYGDEGMPPTIAGGATLIFDIELLAAKPLDPAPDVSPPRPEVQEDPKSVEWGTNRR